MPGKPGSGGPVPKRSGQRRRANKPDVPIIQAAGAESVPIPGPIELWHHLAREWFESLKVSGQAQFFEPSDWAQARIWADLLSRALLSDRPSGMMIAAWAAGASELLTTEGARRRMRIELERAKPVDADAELAGAMILDLADKLGG